MLGVSYVFFFSFLPHFTSFNSLATQLPSWRTSCWGSWVCVKANSGGWMTAVWRGNPAVFYSRTTWWVFSPLVNSIALMHCSLCLILGQGGLISPRFPLDAVGFCPFVPSILTTIAKPGYLLLGKLGGQGQIQQQRLDDGEVERNPCRVLFPDNIVFATCL